MNTKNFSFEMANNNFKTTCKTSRKKIKNSNREINVELSSLNSLRKKQIRKQQLEREIEKNIELTSLFRRHYSDYSKELQIAKVSSTKKEGKNIQRRLKRANINYENLLVNLYKLNLKLLIEDKELAQSIEKDIEEERNKFFVDEPEL